MQKLYKPVRVGIIFVVIAVLLTIYVSALYRLQIYEDRPTEDELYPHRTITRTVTLPAARGNIYDRNGVLLASGRPSYNIVINREALGYAPDRNAVIQELVYTTMDNYIQYNDTFPITRGAPFTYVTDMTSEQRRRLDAYFSYFNYDPDISASDLLASMRSHYKIDYTVGIAEARLIIGIRYELEIRAIVGNIAPYVFANDVGTEFISLIEERSLPGVYVETGYLREYHTIYAAHLLGYIRPMTDKQVEHYYKDLDYPLDALVGQTGAEAAFEELLHGVDGKQVITISDTGTVMNVITLREPVPGQHVYLTIDIDLQMAVERALNAHIDVLNMQREEEGDMITGGAAVVTDVRTGELLAAASYPTFNPMTLSQDFARLNADLMRPMLNRATQGRYNPGSTFKMVTGFAGLRHGVITRYFPVNDVGVYDVLGDDNHTYRPTCWYYQLNGVGHGELDIVQALERSCNYFFMYVADRLEGGGPNGAEVLAEVAQEFGLGRTTGLEIPENPGRLATPEWKREVFNSGWWRGDTVATAFGQGDNVFTPIQLANYAATIANGGTLHALTILRRIKSSDFSELLYVHEPEVLNEIEETEYIEILQEGMKAVARGSYGTAKSVFRDYPVHIAAKTGTVQQESSDINNGVFICYAPAEEPEIAISVVIEKGGSGSAVMDAARMILDYYFRKETNVLATPYGELIP